MNKANSAPDADARRKRVSLDWRETFLAALAQTSNVSAAARKAGIDASAVYKARRADPGFKAQWFEALCEGYDNLEMDLVRRLRMGDLERTGTKSRRKYDNATAFRLLTVHRESVGREKARRDHDDEETILASINTKLDAMRAREKDISAMVPDKSGPDVKAGDDAG